MGASCSRAAAEQVGNVINRTIFQQHQCDGLCLSHRERPNGSKKILVGENDLSGPFTFTRETNERARFNGETTMPADASLQHDPSYPCAGPVILAEPVPFSVCRFEGVLHQFLGDIESPGKYESEPDQPRVLPLVDVVERRNVCVGVAAADGCSVSTDRQLSHIRHTRQPCLMVTRFTDAGA